MDNYVQLIGGVGVIITAFTTLMWKMWRSHADVTKKVIEVVATNAAAVQALKSSTDQTNIALNRQQDALSRVLIKLARTKK